MIDFGAAKSKYCDFDWGTDCPAKPLSKEQHGVHECWELRTPVDGSPHVHVCRDCKSQCVTGSTHRD